MPYTPSMHWRMMRRITAAERRGDPAEVKLWLDIAERVLKVDKRRRGLFHDVQKHEAFINEHRRRMATPQDRDRRR